jgi:hypothetical protein
MYSLQCNVVSVNVLTNRRYLHEFVSGISKRAVHAQFYKIRQTIQVLLGGRLNTDTQSIIII